MKILILSPSKKLVGGVERFCSYLKDIFESDGNVVNVLTPEDIPGFREVGGFLNKSIVAAWRAPIEATRLGRYARRQDYDVIITNGMLGWNIKKGRIINVQHGNLIAAAESIDKGRNIFRWAVRKFVWGYFERAAARRAGEVVAVSQDAANATKKYYGVESAVIGNAVDTDRFRPSGKSVARESFGLPQDKRIVLFVGRIGAQKGESILRELLAAFEKENIILATAADKKLADSPALIHLGAVPQEKLPYLYASADVFVLPSLQEGSAFVVLEAMSCETPFVITTTGDGEEIAHYGTVLKKGVAEEVSFTGIYRAIKEILGMPNGEREVFKKEEREYILEKHSLPFFKERYRKLLYKNKI